MKKLFLILSLFICFKAFGQTPTSPTPVSQMSWYKDLTGHMWAYRGTTLGWIQFQTGSGGGAFLPKANNGLTIASDSTIQLGGNLLNNTTTIELGQNILNMTGLFVTGNGSESYFRGLRLNEGSIQLGTQYNTPSGDNLGVLTTNILMEPGFIKLIKNKIDSTTLNQVETSISISANNLIELKDEIRNKGAIYSSDYSTNGKLDNRWIPDWGAVKAAIDSAGAGGSITASNGLTKVGNDIQLGGVLTGAANIIGSGSTNTFGVVQADDISSPTTFSQISTQYSLGDGTSVLMLSSDLVGGVNTQMGVSKAGAVMSSAIAGSGTELKSTALNIIATDNTSTPKGITNAGDYEANFVNRSLVTKQYVTGISATKLDTTGKSLNAKRDFGAVGNSKTLTDVVTTAGSNIITSASANFTSADIGKTIGIAYGGTDTLTYNVRKPFKSTIASINSTTSVNLVTNVIATIAGPRTITGVSMTAMSNTVSCSGCTMTQNDKGKQVTIPGVGPINSQIDSNSTCYIYGVINSTSFLVSKKALYTTSNRTVTIPGAWAVYGSDDTAPLQNAINSAISTHKKLEIPEGKYLTTNQIVAGSNLTIEGRGAGSTILYPVGSGFSAIQANHGSSDTISRNVHFRYFEMDCMGLGTNQYNAINKAMFVLPIIDFSLEYVTIRNASATGFGCDFLKNYLLLGNKLIHNGRQGFEFQSFLPIPGAAGIGIGTGKWQDEGGSAISNYADNNFAYGLFWEGQDRRQFAGGAKIIGNFTTFTHLNGIGDLGTDAELISNNYSIYDGTGIRSDQSPYQIASNLSYARNGEYSGNIVRNSFGTLGVFNTKYGGQKITNNTFENTLPTGSTAGVKIIGVDSTGSNIKEIVFQGNKIKGILGNGLSIETGNASETLGSVVVTGNTFINNGLSNTTPGVGISLTGKTTNLIIRNNTAFDNRLTTSRTQKYGFFVPSAITTGEFFYGENNFFNNILAPDSYANLTPTTYNIGQPLIKNANTSPLTVTRAGTSLNSTIAIGDDGNQVFMGKSSVSDVWGVGNTADINGTGTLFVNTTSNRVGIGTNTPTFMLHVEGASALGLLKRNSAVTTNGPKLIMARTGSTLTTDIAANYILGGIQFRGRVSGTDSDYGQLGYLANSTTVGDGKFSFYKANLTTSVFDINNNTGAVTIPVLTASQAVFTDAGSNLISVASTGTGNNVLATSPSLSGTPLAPTATVGTNTAQIATTAFVLANSLTNPMTTLGDMIYGGSSGVATRRLIGSTGNVLTVSGGVPTWSVPAAADSTISRTVANSYSLSGMQTKLNLYVAKAGTETITGVKTFSFGMNIQSGGRLGFLGATNSVGLIADDPGGTSYDVSLPAMTSQVSVAVTNSTTVVLSSATLNSTYPNAKPGTQIICQSIIAGAVIYVKASGTTWLTVASTITP